MLRKSSSGGGAVKRTQGLPRHLSNPSTGFLSAGSTKTWDMGRASKNNNPLNSIGLESHIVGAPGVDPDYVMQLVNDVRTFADVLLNLKKAFQSKELQEGLQPTVQERLAELLRVLKAVIGKHPSLNSTDILGAAGTVIARVKAVDCREVSPENKKAIFGEIYASIDTLAFTFGNVVSDFLMGDVDSGPGLGIPQTRRTRVRPHMTLGELCYQVALSREEEVDLTLQKNQSGVESALLYAKAWSKYIKDLLAWVEKRLAMDIECAKSYGKMAESAKALLSQQDYMPFSDIYVSTLKKDIEYSQLLVQSVMALQTNKFIQPLSARKNELDKLRKDIKEQWQREQKKMLEAEASMRKARALQAQRREEYQRARSSTIRSQEEQQQQTQPPATAAGSKQLEKKRKIEEEALQKVEEAQEQCRSCSADAGARRMDLANAKSTVLTQIRELVFRCDLTLKAVTVNWFQMQQAQNVTLPTHFQALSESAKLYEPGERYAEFVRNLPQDLPKGRVHSDSVSSDRFLFHKRSVDSSHSSHGNLSQASGELLSGDEVDSPLYTRPGKSNCVGETQAPRGPTRAWASGSQGSQSGMCSDSESAGGSSESRSMDSPTTSPGVFKRQLPRTPSTGTMSSADDLDERELPSPSDNGLAEMVTETASSPGPFRNAQMSKAAQSHKLRKLRAPSKCRECDSLVVFHGAECEECSLACHKKCLETLAIQCGHKKLQGRLHLFGIDFAQAAKNSPDGVPFIIRKCTSEIESRALNIKGIYRVNGAKSRVEKLCQAFENGKELVELSDLSPHDISNVLKLYLRQLPEPLILYRHYNDFIGLAKECQRVLVEEAEAVRAAAQTAEKRGPSVQLNRVIFKIRDLLRQLPPAHYKTLRFLIAHLHRVTEQAEENKMTASNLGIIFGPTLVKPRQTDAEVSLSSLVDYPYQALMVEQLVRHFNVIFDRNAAQLSTSDLQLAAGGGQASPRLTAQEKEQRLSRHSTSLMDIKESGRVYKRHSSVIPSAHILNEMAAVQPGMDRTSALVLLNGDQTPAPGQDTQRSALVYGRPNLPHSSSTTTSMVPKVQLRPQRSRLASRPISMPLERLSSADTYYITPYIDTHSMQRRTWDRKYKHYDVTPRTAMIMANLPPASAAVPPAARPSNVTTATASSGVPSPLITLRAPRTLQPPPETFYKPPVSAGPQARTLPNWTAASTASTSSTSSPPSSPHSSQPAVGGASPPSLSRLRSEDSGEGSTDSEVSLPFDPLSPPPSSPDDLSPGGVKPVYQRLRSRRLQELEHREAHFV
uniref:Rho GTPase-activating protein 29 n=1 Tax=Gadus morhua TaxID=8049 RepID=A0A8C4ZG86_GADMO